MALLTNIFGPSRDDVWAKIAHDIGGRFQMVDFLEKVTSTSTTANGQF